MPEPRCRHGLVVCSRCVIITDAARRICDKINQYLTWYNPFEIRNQWLAFRLQDGTDDGNMYPTKQMAIRHQPNENYCMYVCFRGVLGGGNYRDCQIMLNMYRHAYANGGHFVDPDDMTGGPQRILGSEAYDRIQLWRPPG